MSLFYLDTSSVVKRYHTEPGTQAVDALLEGQRRGDTFYTSILMLVEIVAVIKRLEADGKLTKEEVGLINSRIRIDLQIKKFLICSLDDNIARQAVRECLDHGLSPADAIHLASAKYVARYESVPLHDLVIVSNDKGLLRAAEEAGFSTSNPQ